MVSFSCWLKEREGFTLYATIKLPQMKAKVIEFNGLLTEQKVRVVVVVLLRVFQGLSCAVLLLRCSCALAALDSVCCQCASIHAILTPVASGAYATTQHAAALDAGDLKAFERLCVNLGDVAGYHSAPFTSDEAKVMLKLLQWPSERVLPVLDAFRSLMCHGAAVKVLMR